jgi:hypothetical protein
MACDAAAFVRVDGRLLECQARGRAGVGPAAARPTPSPVYTEE